MAELTRARAIDLKEHGSIDHLTSLAEDALLPHLEVLYEQWLSVFFGSYMPADMAPHHQEFWQWLWAIEDGKTYDPFIAAWSRGGAKSTSLELGVVALGARRKRRYCLYVCNKQDQADDHVANIGGMLESTKFAAAYPAHGNRALGKYGTSKGWRRTRLRTASGFTVDAIGLDTAARGVKLDAERPDLIVLDDLDEPLDSVRTTNKKITLLTRSLLPAQAEHAVVVGGQNVITPTGIFARLVGVSTQRADMLQNRRVSGPVPAVKNLVTRRRPRREGDAEGREEIDEIVSGEPTWKGQDLTACQQRIDTFGLRAFLIECQHDVKLQTSGMFKPHWWRLIDVEGIPKENMRWIRYWDKAGTEKPDDREKGKDPDWTVGMLVGMHTEGLWYVTDMRRIQDSALGVDVLMKRIAQADKVLVQGKTEIWIEQEPGASGLDSIDKAQRFTLPGFPVYPDPKSGTLDSKVSRAKVSSAAAEAGNVFVLQAPWTEKFIEEHELFPAGPHDDIVDALSGAMHCHLEIRGRLVI
jgi:predicted phage terminase large subunit-like protein